MPKNGKNQGFLCLNLAERVGFEPTEGFPSAVFKTAAIDHSAISPKTISFSSPPRGEATYYGTGILYCKTRFTRKTRRGVTRRARKAPAAHTEGTEWRPMLRMDRLVFLRDLEI